MSVIETECALISSGEICSHIERFYPHISGEPAIFCRIPVSELPIGAEVRVTPSDLGDDCHREIEGVGNGALKKHFRAKRHFTNFYICDGRGPRKLEESDFKYLGS